MNTDTLIGVGVSISQAQWQSCKSADEWKNVNGDWLDVVHSEKMQASLDFPAFIQNYGDAAALAQLLSGAGTDLQDFLAISIGSGISAGLVLGGSVRHSRHGRVGVPAEASECLTGGNDNAAHYGPLGKPVEHDTYQTSAQVQLYVQTLVSIIDKATSLLDLEAVIIDGAQPQNFLLEIASEVRSRFLENAPSDIIVPDIRVGPLGDVVIAVGAGLIPLDASFAPDLSSLFKTGPYFRYSGKDL